MPGIGKLVVGITLERELRERASRRIRWCIARPPIVTGSSRSEPLTIRSRRYICSATGRELISQPIRYREAPLRGGPLAFETGPGRTGVTR